MKFRLVFITLFITAVSFSQNKGAITGILTDKEANNQSLPFANVLIKEKAMEPIQILTEITLLLLHQETTLYNLVL